MAAALELKEIKESTSGLQIVLHPLVVISITDHFSRVQAETKTRGPRVCGGLIGTQSGRHVEVENAFPVHFEVVDGVVSFDMSYLERVLAKLQQVQDNLEFLGWYSTGTVPTAEDLTVQENLRESGVNDSPLYLLVDPMPQPGAKDLPIAIFESQLRLQDEQVEQQFVRTPWRLDSGEAERLAVDHVARSSATGESGTSSLVGHLGGIGNAVALMKEGLLTIQAYLTGVHAGTIDADPAILRHINALVSRLPAANDADFPTHLQAEQNDALLVTYLATITKGASAVNDMVDKVNIVFGARSGPAGIGAGSGGFPHPGGAGIGIMGSARGMSGLF